MQTESDEERLVDHIEVRQAALVISSSITKCSEQWKMSQDEPPEGGCRLNSPPHTGLDSLGRIPRRLAILAYRSRSPPDSRAGRDRSNIFPQTACTPGSRPFGPSPASTRCLPSTLFKQEERHKAALIASTLKACLGQITHLSARLRPYEAAAPDNCRAPFPQSRVADPPDNRRAPLRHAGSVRTALSTRCRPPRAPS